MLPLLVLSLCLCQPRIDLDVGLLALPYLDYIHPHYLPIDKYRALKGGTRDGRWGDGGGGVELAVHIPYHNCLTSCNVMNNSLLGVAVLCEAITSYCPSVS